MDLTAGTGTLPTDTTPTPPSATLNDDSAETATIRPSSPSAAVNRGPSLEQEFDQMLHSLQGVGSTIGSFWGSFKKQSTAALQSSRKEFDTYATKARQDLAPMYEKAKGEVLPFVNKAKEELAKLEEEAKAAQERNRAAGRDVIVTADGTVIDTGNFERESKGKEKGVEGESEEVDAEAAKEQAAKNVDSFFNALQTQWTTANATLQSQLSHLPENLHHLQEQMNSTTQQLQSQASNFQHSLASNPRLTQSQKLAEQYRLKATTGFSKFSSDIGKYLNEAIQVLPPSPSAATPVDMTRSRSQLEKLTTSRKEGLIQRLRTDPAILLVDPLETEKDGEGKDAWEKFEKTLEEEGGIEGEKWKTRIKEELEQAAGQEHGLAESLASIVPEKIQASDYWKRYFYRLSQIEADEARRRAVLEAAPADEEESFTWDMDEEESSKASESGEKEKETSKKEGDESKRNSSEGTMSSYDLVSEGNGANASASQSPKVEKKEIKKEKEKDDDDDDSDWE